MTATPITPTSHRRRWLQVSLRTFLALMLLVSVGTGWLGIVIQRGREQRSAVIEIQKMGGRVTYDEPSTFLQRSSWLHSMLGEDTFLNVVCVFLYNT